MSRKIKKLLMITIACLIYGAGISLFVDPNNLAPGGFTGLSVILSKVIGRETGTWYLFLNIPVIIIAIRRFGWKFTTSTIYAILIVSVATNLFSAMNPLTLNPMLGAIFGGVLIAVGMGSVLRMGTTTGGMDIIVKCLRQRFLHLKTGTILLLTDGIIITLNGVLFADTDSVLYSIVAAVTTSYVLDLVLYGRDSAKMIYIISDRYQAITGRILNEIGIGVTHLSGSGAYAGKEKKVILCVVRKQIAHQVEEVVRQEDAGAFMIVSSATEIYGEGYKSYFGEVL